MREREEESGWEGPGAAPWMAWFGKAGSGSSWRRFEKHMRHGHRHGRGGGFGWGPPGGWPFGRGPGPRVRRGDVRAAVLALLAEEPRNGYQIIQAIAERSGGVWRPGSGSVYPALQLLEDEGLVRVETADGRKLYHLTEEGRAYVKSHKAELADPWGEVAGTVDEGEADMHSVLARLGMAIVQVMHVANDAQITKARQIIVNATGSLYQILAEAAREDDGD